MGLDCPPCTSDSWKLPRVSSLRIALATELGYPRGVGGERRVVQPCTRSLGNISVLARSWLSAFPPGQLRRT